MLCGNSSTPAISDIKLVTSGDKQRSRKNRERKTPPLVFLSIRAFDDVNSDNWRQTSSRQAAPSSLNTRKIELTAKSEGHSAISCSR